MTIKERSEMLMKVKTAKNIYIYMKGFVKSKCVRIGANVNLSLS